MKKICWIILAAAIAVGSQVAVQAADEVISSASFTFGFGYFTNGSGSAEWNTVENAGNSSPTTQGNFTFSPAPSGPSFSGGGPSFINRTLGSGDVQSGYINPAFTVPITASYNGAAPGNAAPNPNYRLRINITKISIWAGVHPSNTGGTDLAWDEVTPGHLQSSSTNSLLPAGDHNLAPSYKQFVWDPADYDTTLASLNDSFTRTFDIIPGGDLWYADGMEIEGNVQLLYIPEPSSVALLVLGGLLVLGRRRSR